MNCPLCLDPVSRVFCEKTVRGKPARVYRECGSCGLIFLPPEFHLSEDEEKKRYELHQNNRTDKGYLCFLNRLAGPLARRMPPGASGLDFGCGPNPVLAGMLEERGFLMQVYDPYFYPQKPLANRCFDFIAVSEAAEHFRNPRREFEWMKSLLGGPGRCLGVMTRVFRDSMDFKTWWYPQDSTHITFYRRETMDWIAAWLGFSLEEAEEDVFLFLRPARNAGPC